jgi:hypothetical protein
MWFWPVSIGFRLSIVISDHPIVYLENSPIPDMKIDRYDLARNLPRSNNDTSNRHIILTIQVAPAKHSLIDSDPISNISCGVYYTLHWQGLLENISGPRHMVKLVTTIRGSRHDR